MVPVHRNQARDNAAAVLFRASIWLALVFVAIKVSYLGLPGAAARTRGQFYLASLAAITYVDGAVVFGSWLAVRLLLALVGRSRRMARGIAAVYVALSALSCLYFLANVVMLESFGGFLTYQLLAVVGSVRMLRSSLSAYITVPFALSLAAIPLAFVAVVWISGRASRFFRGAAAVSVWTTAQRAAAAGMSVLLVASWIGAGSASYSARWATRQDRAIAESPQWVLATSWWRATITGTAATFADSFDPADLSDFAPPAAGKSRAAPPVRRVALRVPPRKAPPLNVVMIVLESVGARWTTLNGAYRTTPTLETESAHGLAFNNFYAHIGRSSSSLAAILLSKYPKLDFRDLTDQYPRLQGTSLASLFEDRGYRTAFVTPSDLEYAGWTTFLQGRGFRDIADYRQLSCTPPVSSWGVEDRCMVDRIIDIVSRDAATPFFVMGWTQQTHHPYEPTPGIPLLDLVREPMDDDWDLNRYLNVLHETDRHLGRLFDAIRLAGLDQQTMVVVVGDHGQAFGYPHEFDYTQGTAVYEEDVHVPLLVWSPRRFAGAMRSNTIGAHVDLAPTIAELAGLPPAADWEGRSLLDPDHIPRAYFYAAGDHFRLGVREHDWKYSYDLRDANETLFDLQRDPTEQHDLAPSQPALSARLRQRLAAWAEANRRRYQQ
jgi:phosphoglycerol transferase MdoB-like AlkP superfamily enzyme